MSWPRGEAGLIVAIEVQDGCERCQCEVVVPPRGVFWWWNHSAPTEPVPVDRRSRHPGQPQGKFGHQHTWGAVTSPSSCQSGRGREAQSDTKARSVSTSRASRWCALRAP